MHILTKHLMVTGVIAPVSGVAASALFGAFSDGKLSSDVLGALQLSLVGLGVVWAASFPLGFATYFIFGFAARHGWSSWSGWLVACGVIGLLFGSIAGLAVGAAAGITGIVGLATGVGTGAWLYSMWMREVNRAAFSEGSSGKR